MLVPCVLPRHAIVDCYSTDYGLGCTLYYPSRRVKKEDESSRPRHSRSRIFTLGSRILKALKDSYIYQTLLYEQNPQSAQTKRSDISTPPPSKNPIIRRLTPQDTKLSLNPILTRQNTLLASYRQT